MKPAKLYSPKHSHTQTNSRKARKIGLKQSKRVAEWEQTAFNKINKEGPKFLEIRENLHLQQRYVSESRSPKLWI